MKRLPEVSIALRRLLGLLLLVVAPALRRFRPEFILVSAGQDAAASDTHGRMGVTTEGFRAMASETKRLAEELCGCGGGERGCSQVLECPGVAGDVLLAG